MEESKVIMAPNVARQKLSVFKLHKDDDVSWAEAKMKRENDFQPWQIKLGNGRAARRFRALKEGGVGENASYFIFYKPDPKSDTYEVCPVDEWYNVSATQRYKTLTAEEAEQKFEQRHKTLNYFSVMHMKKNGESGEEKMSASDSKAFKITEMDDWDESGDDFSGSDRDGDDDMAAKKKQKKKIIKKEDNEGVPEEGKEDSDEGDFEQREVDYMSDTSSSSGKSSGNEKDESDVKGIAEEEALRDLLSSDDEDNAEGSPNKTAKSPLNKAAIVTTDINSRQQDLDGEGSEDSSDSDDYDVDEDKMDSMFMKKSLPAQLVKQEVMEQDSTTSSSGAAVSSSTTVQKQSTSATQSGAIANKRKPDSSQAGTSFAAQPVTSPPKKHCPADYSSSAPANSHEKVVEDLIKKYLSRKPMTLRALLKDIKNKLKRMGNSSSEMDKNLVETIATIINRIKPERQKINDTIYLSLKA